MCRGVVRGGKNDQKKKKAGEICGKTVVGGILFYLRIDDINTISNSVKSFYNVFFHFEHGNFMKCNLRKKYNEIFKDRKQSRTGTKNYIQAVTSQILMLYIMHLNSFVMF